MNNQNATICSNTFEGRKCLFDLAVSRDDVLLELDHEGRALVPVGRNLGRKVAAVKNSLDDAGGEGRAVERALILWH